MTKKIAYILATGLGSGYSPVIPGTAGSFTAVLLFLLIPDLFIVQLFLICLVYFTGVWASKIIEADQGKDPGIVVIDEIAGQWIALLFLPLSMKAVLTAFILFRVFDIWKPFPVNYMEKLPHGWGIMTDDVIAGIYANLSAQIVLMII